MNPETLEILLRETTWMKRLATQLVATSADADEILSETFLAATTKPFEDNTRARGWLARVLRNRAARRRHRNVRRVSVESAAAVSEARSMNAGTVEKLEIHTMLVRAIRSLEEHQRTTVVLRYFEDLDNAEIARRMAVDIGTVRSRLSRAIATLRRKLTAEFNGDQDLWRSMLLPFVFPEASSNAVAVGSSTMVKKIAAASLAVIVLCAAGYLMFDRDDPIDDSLSSTVGSTQFADSESRARRRLIPLADSTSTQPSTAPESAPTGPLRAMVRDSRGQPVGNANLEWMFEGHLVASQITDAGGIALLGASPRPSRVLVIARNHASIVFDVPPLGESVDFELPQGAVVAGRITVEGQAPGYEFNIELFGDLVPSASFPMEVQRSLWSRDLEIPPIGRVLADGTFRFEGLRSKASGRINLPFQFTLATMPRQEPIIHFDAAREDIAVDVGVTQSIVGRVVDADGRPAKTCLAIAEFLGESQRGEFGTLTRSFSTKLNGEFRLDLRTRSTSSVDLQFRWRGQRITRQITDLAPGVTDLGDIAFAKGKSISIRVLQSDGRPIPGAIATLSEGVRSKRPAVSDSEGRILLEDLAEETARVEVAARRYQTQIVPVTGDSVEVVLEPTNELTVKVTDDEGRPIDGANVRLRALVEGAKTAKDVAPQSPWIRGDDLLWMIYTNQGAALMTDPLARRYMSDADGLVELPNIRTDAEIEAVVVDRWNRPISERGSARLGATESRRIELVVRRDARRTWRFRATDAEGRPISRAAMQIRPAELPSSDPWKARTDDDGYLNLSTGGSTRLAIKLAATAEFLPLEVEKDPPTDEGIVEIIVDRRPIALSDGVARTLVIREASGRSYGGVIVVRKKGEESFVAGNADGEFLILGIPPEGAAVRYAWGEVEFERIVGPLEERPTIVLPELATLRIKPVPMIEEDAMYRVSLLFEATHGSLPGTHLVERYFSGKWIRHGRAELPDLLPGRATIRLEKLERAQRPKSPFEGTRISAADIEIRPGSIDFEFR